MTRDPKNHIHRDAEKEEASQLKLHVRQTVTAMGSLISVLAAGATNGYSAVLLPQLRSYGLPNGTENAGNDEVRVNSIEEESWIAAAAVLPMAPACMLGGALMEKFGRRTAGLVTCPLFLAGWLMVALAGDAMTIIVGRLFCGICVGLVAPLCPIYISETSDPKMRGILVSGTCVALSIGIIISHALGTWLHWRLTAFLCAIAPIVCIVFFVIGKESPIWLLANKRTEQARENWIYLRGTQADYELVMMMERTKNVGIENQKKSGESVWKIIWTAEFLKPLGIISLLFITCQSTGINTITFYSVLLLADVFGPKNAYLGSLVIDVVRLIFSILSCILVKKYGRRTLCLFSGTSTAITLFFLSGCLLFEIGLPWTSAIALIANTAVVFIGLVPLPWILCGELFPRKCRGLGSGLTSGLYFAYFFVVVKTGLAMLESLHAYGTFLVYGVITLIGTIILHVVLPETKNKSLEEIERFFSKKQKQVKNSKVEVQAEKLISPQLAPS